MKVVSRLIPIVSLAALASLAACSDSTGPTAFNAANLDTQLQSVSASFTGNAAFQSLLTLYPSFPQFSAVRMLGATLPASGASPGGAGAAAVNAVRMAKLAVPRAPNATTALFPANVLGKTFAWDADSGYYRVDSTITGAPANGVRIRLYTVDQGTGLPVVPLQVLGYLELRDQSTAAATIIGVTLKLGATTVADYSITHIAGTTSVSVTVSGYLTNGDGTGQVTFNQSLQAKADSVNWVSTLTTSSASVHVELHGDTLGNGTELFRLQSGGNTLDFAGTSTSSDFNGQVNYNGAEIATITVSGGADPVFTDANGHTLTTSDKVHLVALFGGMELMTFAFFIGLLAPLFIFSALSVAF